MVHVGTADGRMIPSRSCRSQSYQWGGGCLVSVVVGATAGDDVLPTGINVCTVVGVVVVLGVVVVKCSRCCVATVACSILGPAGGEVLLHWLMEGMDTNKGGLLRACLAVWKGSCFGKTWSYSCNVGSQISSSLMESNRLYLSSLLGEQKANDDGFDDNGVDLDLVQLIVEFPQERICFANALAIKISRQDFMKRKNVWDTKWGTSVTNSTHALASNFLRGVVRFFAFLWPLEMRQRPFTSTTRVGHYTCTTIYGQIRINNNQYSLNSY